MPIILQALSWTPNARTASAFETFEILEAFAAPGGPEVVALVAASALAEAPAGLAVHGVPSLSTPLAALAFETRGAARLAASLSGEVLYNLEESRLVQIPYPCRGHC